jgi:tetratricopeptide (TPR) repeat protein
MLSTPPPHLLEQDIYRAAVLLYAGGRYSEALEQLQPLLQLFSGKNPTRLPALNLAAICSLCMEKTADAENYWRQAIDGSPDYARTCCELGTLLKGLNRPNEAEAIYRQALTLRPDYAEAHYDLGVLLHSLHRLPEAVTSYRSALALRPDLPMAGNNLGAALHDLKCFPEAEAVYRQVLEVSPHYADAHYNLARLLTDLRRLPEAEAAIRQALKIRPDLAEAWNNLGHVLVELDRFSEAEAAYREALAIRPHYPHACDNLAVMLHRLNRVDEAEEAYRQTLALDPAYADAKFGLAALLLGDGRFAQGWPLFESRYAGQLSRRHSFPPNVSFPQWQGEALQGRSLLVWHEQGYGDMIQFGRYLCVLKAQGASRIALACRPELQRLFRTANSVDEVVDPEAVAATGYDFWTFAMSVPLHLGTTVESIPSAVYLKPEAALVERWGRRLEPLQGCKIGLVWKGSATHANDRIRSLPSLTTLEPLWSLPHASFVSLQKGPGETEPQCVLTDHPLLNLGPELSDFADTAAIIAQLDLVICVDTSVAHLAGALGKPCWVLLAATDTEWRWTRKASGSPWYSKPTRLFRQAVPGDWTSTIAQICEAYASVLDRDRTKVAL